MNSIFGCNPFFLPMISSSPLMLLILGVSFFNSWRFLIKIDYIRLLVPRCRYLTPIPQTNKTIHRSRQQTHEVSIFSSRTSQGLDIWYSPLTKQAGASRNTGSVKALQRLQRMATLAITGALRSTPTNLLDALHHQQVGNPLFTSILVPGGGHSLHLLICPHFRCQKVGESLHLPHSIASRWGTPPLPLIHLHFGVTSTPSFTPISMSGGGFPHHCDLPRYPSILKAEGQGNSFHPCFTSILAPGGGPTSLIGPHFEARRVGEPSFTFILVPGGGWSPSPPLLASISKPGVWKRALLVSGEQGVGLLAGEPLHLPCSPQFRCQEE